MSHRKRVSILSSTRPPAIRPSSPTAMTGSPGGCFTINISHPPRLRGSTKSSDCSLCSPRSKFGAVSTDRSTNSSKPHCSKHPSHCGGPNPLMTSWQALNASAKRRCKFILQSCKEPKIHTPVFSELLLCPERAWHCAKTVLRPACAYRNDTSAGPPRVPACPKTLCPLQEPSINMGDANVRFRIRCKL